MACITLVAPFLAMTTTQLTRAIRFEEASVRQFEGERQCNPLRLSWVVVTDERGTRQLRMLWASADA